MVVDADFRLELKGIEKSFGGARALSGVDFAIRPGEIHGLIGPNGAGKSTLIKIIAGLFPPDVGSIHWLGSEVRFNGPADAARLGIAAIHQELALAPNLSVAENFFLGREPHFWGWVDHARIHRDAAEALIRLRMEEIGDPKTKVADLSTARRQLVEIARALNADARLLILDEPTSSLSREEVELLFGTLRKLAAAGASLIFISHRLEELRAITSRITLLRDGKTEGTRSTTDLTSASIAEWVAGSGRTTSSATMPLQKNQRAQPTGKDRSVALKVTGLRSRKLQDIHLEVNAGEIVGVAGRLGSGRSSLLRAIYGVDRPLVGSVRVGERNIPLGNPKASREAGLAFTPEDRKRCGLVLGNTVGFNLAIPWTKDWIVGPFHRNQMRNKIVERGMQSFGVKAAGPHSLVQTLSGGNQQKVVLSKAMERPPRIFLLDEPTRGIDVAARADIHARLRALADSGMAILVASSELDELLTLSNRLLLIHNGRLVGETAAAEVDEATLVARLAEMHE